MDFASTKTPAMPCRGDFKDDARVGCHETTYLHFLKEKCHDFNKPAYVAAGSTTLEGLVLKI